MLYKFFSKYYIKNKALCLITEDLDSSFLLCTGELHNPAQVTSMHWVLLLPSLKWEISPKHITVTSIKENPVRGHSMKIGQKSKVLKSDRLKRTYLLNTLSSVLRATSIYSVNICRMNELLFNKKRIYLLCKQFQINHLERDHLITYQKKTCQISMMDT